MAAWIAALSSADSIAVRAKFLRRKIYRFGIVEPRGKDG